MIGEVETSATIETGTVVVETSGYFKNCEFVMLENGKGLHDKFGVRALIAPVRKSRTKVRTFFARIGCRLAYAGYFFSLVL